LVGDWLSKLKDASVRARVQLRIDRVESGNFGDSKSLGSGLHELRIYVGPGFRIYYAMLESTGALLLCGGDKSRQSSDIEPAKLYLREYKERTNLR
jgi:putative addiction module killer protein